MGAIKGFYMRNDRELVDEIINGQATLSHATSERIADDIKDALRDILSEYDAMKDEVAQLYEMERHIEKLEAMLDRRKVRYKKWEDVDI